MKKKIEYTAPYQPESFTFRDANLVNDILGRYPKDKSRSATMPLLDLAQRQVAEDGAMANPPFGGWIPRAAMDEIAKIVGIPTIKVYEVATFYSMYNVAPVGKYLIQLCTTTPCMLCGSQSIMTACEEHLGIHAGQTTPDGLFTLIEVECLGACVNAPMAQINDDYYEDLTPESTKQLLNDLAANRPPSVGSLKGRRGSMAMSGPTSLLEQAERAGIKSA